MFKLFIFHQDVAKIKNQVSEIDNLDLCLFSDIKWETCRRRIYFFHDQQKYEECKLKKLNGDWLSEIEAEAFLIEILCGLHSPVIGETEILGQFRKFIATNSSNKWVKNFSKNRLQIWQKIIKKVRDEHLYNLGSQSYGSFLRKHIKSVSEIAILGSGQLVEDILPWFEKEKKSISIYCRSPETSLTNYNNRALLSIKHINQINADKVKNKCLIIAAPIEHTELTSILDNTTEVTQVFDLRHNSSDYNAKRICSQSWIDLNHVMNSFTQQKEHLQLRTEKARQAIQLWKRQEIDHIQVRPFGWEDLCC